MSRSVYDPSGVWTVQTLQELCGIPAQNQTVQPDPPGWYVNPSTITIGKLNEHLFVLNYQVHDGEWLGSPVTIIKPNDVVHSSLDDQQLKLAPFCAGIRKWHPLNHPHIMKLFGACHRGQLLMVTERLAKGNLRSYLEQHPHKKWRVLHQVALGLQYLHERGITHEFLCGYNILISDDGKAKLAGFTSVVCSGLSASIHWISPEVISGSKYTYESDIYALGMCIIEAVSGALPYAAEAAAGRNFKQQISDGVLPQRNQLFCDQGWDLVTRMCRCQSRERIKITDVVRELEILSKEERASCSLQRSVLLSRQESTEADLEAIETMEESLAFAFSCLTENRMDDKNLEFQVFLRLNDIWCQLQSSQARSEMSATTVDRYCDIANRFVSEVNMQFISAGSSMESYAAGRQNAEKVFSLHNEIDRAVKIFELDMSSAIHTWREQWHHERTVRLNVFATMLQKLESLPDNVEMMTCLQFELASHRMSYTSIDPQIINEACAKIRSAPGVQVADWFIPPYEVLFDAVHKFNEGSFGSIHHGTWMGSSIVIKKVLVEDDEAFQREVGIWFRLYHPNVVRLFGACHVGQRFFVCELASRGHLKQYLQQLGKTEASRVVWRRLHEAALGLQHLHSLKVQHRDLKCNNILVGRNGLTKLADFGLSSIKPEPLQMPDGKQIGAFRWRAPEILNGEEPSNESDIYGCHLHCRGCER